MWQNVQMCILQIPTCLEYCKAAFFFGQTADLWLYVYICVCIFKNFLLQFLEKLKFNLHVYIYFFLFLQLISDNMPSFQARCLDRIRGGCVVVHVTVEMRDYNFYKQPL